MIRSVFSLTALPFGPLRSPSQLYLSAQVREIQAKLSRLLEHRGLALLTGEVGAGKSSLLTAWRLQLPANSLQVLTLCLPAPTPRALLSQLGRLLNIPRAFHFETLLHHVTCALGEIRDQDRRHPVLILEEAQRFSLDTLDAVRHLADLRPDDRPLLTLVLVAQRDFSSFLKQRAATAFRQRLLFAYHLTGLARDEVGPYVEHHLALAGASRPLFTGDAVAALFNFSQGIPRLINALALDALYLAGERQLPAVEADLVELVAGRREDLA